MYVVTNMHTQYHMTVTSSVIYINTSSVSMVTTVFISTSDSKHVSFIQLYDNVNVKRCVQKVEGVFVDMNRDHLKLYIICYPLCYMHVCYGNYISPSNAHTHVQIVYCVWSILLNIVPLHCSLINYNECITLTAGMTRREAELTM